MKVLTAAQMREVDRRSTELGIPGIILMENAGHRVVEFLARQYEPLEEQRIVIICGKGNNGGDGMVVARQLFTRFQVRSLDVVLAGAPEDLRGDAAENYKMLLAVGCSVSPEITPAMETATLIVDAVLGTGLNGPAEGAPLEMIRHINNGFPLAEVVSIDIPSGLNSDSRIVPGEAVHAAHTVTFTAPKLCQILSPASDFAGRLHVAQIGSPATLYQDDTDIFLALSEPGLFTHLFQPRPRESNKGTFGHVLAIAGARGKTGAAAMVGIAALRSGAGLATVASAESAIGQIGMHAPELMTEPLPETDIGSIALRSLDKAILPAIAENKTVIAVGPGMGRHPETVQVIRRLVEEFQQPMVVDADALNALSRKDLGRSGSRILTPHPGEMSRLCNLTVAEVQANRLELARSFAQERGVHLVLKGDRTIVAAPSGHVWVNPTGSPALATGGTGDILTGLIAGLVAQFPHQVTAAVLAAVYLHGRAGELGAAKLGEKSFMATDILRNLPEAMREAAAYSHAL